MAQLFRFICTKVSTVLVFLLLFQGVSAQYNFSDLDSKLLQYQKQLGNNLVTLIYKDGKIIYTKSLGDFDANTPAPIASCSKWLTAALVMTFVDEGKLSLDDKVSKYLPIFTEYGKNYITIRQCLSHTTGIEDEPVGLRSIIKLSKYKSLEAEVNDFAGKHNIETNPGVEFRYGTIGLNIAGRILEIISKKPFDRLMQDRIFKPLSMKSSSFSTDYEKAVNPSGGAVSSANDYMHFLMMLMDKGMYNNKKVLSEQAIQTMQQPQTTLQIIKYAPVVASGFNYALGEWVQQEDSAGKSIVLSSPGLFGTWPMIDNCHGYACIIFIKSLLSEEKAAITKELKASIDASIPADCK